MENTINTSLPISQYANRRRFVFLKRNLCFLILVAALSISFAQGQVLQQREENISRPSTPTLPQRERNRRPGKISNTAKEKTEQNNKVESFILNEHGGLEQFVTKAGKTEIVLEGDWGAYKYRIDELVGRVVTLKLLQGGKKEYSLMDDFKPVGFKSITTEVAEGDAKSTIYNETECAKLGLRDFFNIGTSREYRIQSIEKDLKTANIKHHELDSVMVKRWFATHTNTSNFLFIEAIVLRQFMFNKFEKKSTEATVGISIVEGEYSYSSSKDDYSVRLKVSPTASPIEALRTRFVK